MYCRQRSTLRRLNFGPKDGEHHTFLSFPNGSDAQILSDFQKHQTVFVSIYPTTGEGLTLRESPATRK